MKQEPRVVALTALGGLLRGEMTLPLGVDRIRLPVPPTETVWIGNGRSDTLDVPVSGADAIEFETTRRYEVHADGKSRELFVATRFPRGDT